jgi:hypothetical protein
MGDQQNGGLLLDPEVLHDRPQFLARELIQRPERLVEQQQGGVLDERPAKRSPLLHAAR